jgi:acetolactate synthase-1/2/3 large subunit
VFIKHEAAVHLQSLTSIVITQVKSQSSASPEIMPEQQVAQIIVESLVNAGVKLVFGIPGAKVDSLFDTLSDHAEIKLVVCRHEQNAAFMAAAVGRITGTPGVCIATSGPGAGNLTTGLVTATTEGDPVVAIVGSVPRLLSTKHTHQSMRALEILRPTAKSASTWEISQ